MREPFHQIYMHLVWATWDRVPLLTRDVQASVYACIQTECQELRCEVVSVGGVEDHVHLLVQMPPSISLAKLVQQIKGSSSHLVTHELGPGLGFKWQGGYGAFSVSKAEVPVIRRYVERQAEDQRTGSLLADYELERDPQ